ncbi:amastin family protein [Leucobacter celer]|jgi:hypothetical protein|uniref:hypothetical protein n=1 Tax=Leucobacter celer TaxID=668625 RepID=UPI0006A78FD2|nr:hypothetical protein [Leucobacter celer]
MRLSSQRQLIAIVVLGACVLATAAVCLFAPLRIALLALLVVPAVCSLVVLVFLRKTLTAVYQLRDSLRGGIDTDTTATSEAVQRELTDVTARLDRIEQHLPERIAARLAFENAQHDRRTPVASDSPAEQ